mmetsp:Transcript_19723/g.31389  ORF Transcript_19723/g.31389 Transcript_19723/m.31389 type:complete len:223 (+) Transcript_19723:369-1037(+)
MIEALVCTACCGHALCLQIARNCGEVKDCRVICIGTTRRIDHVYISKHVVEGKVGVISSVSIGRFIANVDVAAHCAQEGETQSGSGTATESTAIGGGVDDIHVARHIAANLHFTLTERAKHVGEELSISAHRSINHNAAQIKRLIVDSAVVVMCFESSAFAHIAANVKIQVFEGAAVSACGCFLHDERATNARYVDLADSECLQGTAVRAERHRAANLTKCP